MTARDLDVRLRKLEERRGDDLDLLLDALTEDDIDALIADLESGDRDRRARAAQRIDGLGCVRF